MEINILVNNITLSAGTERAVTNLANILAARDYNVRIISSYTNVGEGYYPLDSRVQVLHLGHPLLKHGGLYRLWWSAKYILNVRRLLTGRQKKLLIGTVHGLNFLLPFVTAFTGNKSVACEHISYYSIPRYSRWVRSLLYAGVSRIVVLTEKDKLKYSRRQRVAVISNSLSFFPDHTSAYQHKKIIAAGRLSYQKGFDRLLAAAALLKDKYPDWSIDIFGEGELGPELKTKALDLHVEGFVRFNQPTRAIQEKLLDSSIYVMSSRFEGFPMVLLEAQACGLPCVSFNCPEGPAEIITHGVDGFVVENDNIHQLAAALGQLMEDKSLRETMGKKARQASQKYSPENIFSRWEQLFKSI